MPTIELGLFDIQQVDPLSDVSDQAFFATRLDDLAFADELGFAIAFVAERHYLHTYRCQASSVWLGAASQRTKTMRLGVLAHTLPITPPIRLAEEIALLDQISGGRIEVGLGLGHRTEELDVNLVDAGQRVTMFQERIAIMEGLWSGNAVSSESATTPIRNAFIHPLPIQQPHTPLWIAGTDPGAALWAGQHGMNLAIGFAPSDQLFGATAAFRHGWASQSAGKPATDPIRRGQIALMRQVYIADTDQQAQTEMVGDLLRLGELNQSHTQANRADRHQQAMEQHARLIASETFLAGSPETVARGIIDARNKLGSSLFLASVYAAGVEQARVRRIMSSLMGPVQDALDSLVTRIT